MKQIGTLLAKWMIVCTGMLLAIGNAEALEDIVINEGEGRLIGTQVEYFIDESNELTIDTVRKQDFNQGQTGILNFGVIPHNVWMRFRAASESESELLLDVKAPLLANLELYVVEEGRSRRLFKGGFQEPYGDRPIKTETWLFPLDLGESGSREFYLKGQSIYFFQVPILLASQSQYIENSQVYNLFWGFYIGIMIFALLYNLFIYVSVRERTYLLYIFYVIGSSLFYLGLQGFAFKFLWPNAGFINPHTAAIISVTNIVITMFTLEFLHITRQQKYQYIFGRGLMVLFGLTALLSLFGFYEISISLAQMLSLVACIYFIVCGVAGLRRGIATAKYYLISWTLFLVFTFIFILAGQNVLPSNFFTTHCIFIGHMTEVLLLSFALADRINWLKADNARKQQEIIHQLEEKEAIQNKHTRELELKVEERTREVVQQKNEAERQRERSDELLLNILPAKIADELKTTGKTHARIIEEVTVLFTDFKDFTGFAEQFKPEELVAEINECYSEFDRIMERNGVEKIKTIGDSYMSAGGVPSPNESHAENVANAALEIQKFMRDLEARKSKEGKPALTCRIGMHTGAVVAGVVGTKKFAYDIWGDTVNIANRMESSGEPGKINISETTYEKLKDRFQCEYRGKIEAKHKGLVDMYFLDGAIH